MLHTVGDGLQMSKRSHLRFGKSCVFCFCFQVCVKTEKVVYLLHSFCVFMCLCVLACMPGEMGASIVPAVRCSCRLI